MDRSQRKAAVAEYKERKPLIGLYAVRCAPASLVWVGGSRSPEGQKNKIWFGLRLGNHMNKAMQAAWNAHGEAGFAFEPLETVEEDDGSAFNREYRFPHMLVFADRNRVEKEETFELPSAARDRFMFELRMPTPAEVEVRRSLVFNPDFHDVDELLQRVAPGVLPWQELNRIGAAIQRSIEASEALERYVLDLWDASKSPQRFGVRIDGVDMDKLILAGASPRGMMTLVRAARVVARRPARAADRAARRRHQVGSGCHVAHGRRRPARRSPPRGGAPARPRSRTGGPARPRAPARGLRRCPGRPA